MVWILRPILEFYFSRTVPYPQMRPPAGLVYQDVYQRVSPVSLAAQGLRGFAFCWEG